ncbi:HAD family hydrolase [Saccharococcus caldoxylosilyticus]|uniref:HAD family hydrolase n=1 Tax=Saccharococcus caldoxylosilyticus TaxID=81408 RepID=UPI001C4E2427|nr:HAD family hydrolase [Parageobacillus caldoxylosilyticus]QXJ36959.1 Phosphoglycolate phosphatase [Parageobacillus caldoxylosilyticus]
MDGTNVKAIVFDLDGTLYEEPHHFEYYAEQVAKRLREEDQQRFWEDYRAVLSGRHPLRIGSVYDAGEDLILFLQNGIVSEAYRWNGEKLDEEEVQKIYQERVTIDLDRLFSIGDFWWVPSSIGRHYGLTNEDTYAAFLETREWMMGPDFAMNGVPGLAETLEQLKNRTVLILMTNSPEPDSEAILHKLKLADVFHHKIFQAGKPIKTASHLQTIRDRYHIQYKEMISIGDNLENDILPARRLGCRTIFIDAYGRAKQGDADVIVASMSECVPVLRRLL